MKATVDAKAFEKAITTASTIRAKSKYLPLNEVCVTISDGVCRLTGTTLSQWMVSELPADGDSFSFVFSNTKDIIRICKYFSGAMTLELSVTEHLNTKGKDVEITLSCGSKSASFPASEDDGVHILPEMGEPEQTCRVNAAALLDRVKRVGYASCESASKPSLGGVRFSDKRVWCVDGYRMAINEDDALTVEKPFILPASALLHLKEFGKADVELAVGKKYAKFFGKGISLYCRILAPSDSLTIENVMPKTFSATYQINRKQYLDQVKYLCECVRDAKNVPVLFDSGKLFVFENNMAFRAAVNVIGECSDQHSLKLEYLREALEQFAGAEYVTLSTNSSRTSPVLITAGGADTAFILAMRAANGWERIGTAA